MVDSFPDLMNKINLHIQEAYELQNNSLKIILPWRHHKLLKAKNKGVLKEQEKWLITYKNLVRSTAIL